MSNDKLKVTVYSTSWCGPCKAVKKFLKDNNISFTDHDVESDAAAFKAMLMITGGMRGVPVIVIGNDFMRGYSEQWVRETLRKAGLLAR